MYIVQSYIEQLSKTITGGRGKEGYVKERGGGRKIESGSGIVRHRREVQMVRKLNRNM